MSGIGLLERLSLVSSVDPALLRRTRRQFVTGGDAGTEIDVWMSPLVATRSPSSISLDGSTRAALATTLAESPERYEATWQFFERCRLKGWRSTSPTQRIDEELFYLRHSSRDDAGKRADELLEQVARQLAQPEQEALAYWAEGLLVRLDPSQRSSRSARDIDKRVRSLLDHVQVERGDIGHESDARREAGVVQRWVSLPGRFWRWYRASLRANWAISRHQLRSLANLARPKTPLSPALAALFEPHFPDVDLTRVRVVDEARMVNSESLAVTSYRHVYFRDRFDPTDVESLHALARELSHVEMIQKLGFQRFLRHYYRRPALTDHERRTLEEIAEARALALRPAIEQFVATRETEHVDREAPAAPAATLEVFVSYSRHDLAVTEALVQDIETLGHSAWRDQQLSGGQMWWHEILERIRQCSVVVYLMTDRSLESAACRSEIEYATALGLPVLPIITGDGPDLRSVPGELAQIQWLGYDAADRSSALQLARALSSFPDSGRPLPDPLPTEPDVPIDGVLALRELVREPGELRGDAQRRIVERLTLLRDQGTPAEELLGIASDLRSRPDLLVVVAGDLDAFVAELEAGSSSDEAARSPAEAPPVESASPRATSKSAPSETYDEDDEAGASPRSSSGSSVFISHAPDGADVAGVVAGRMEKRGLRPLLHDALVESGEDDSGVLAERIARADYFVALVSADSEELRYEKSTWNEEVRLARQRQREVGSELFLIPAVIHEGIDPMKELADLRHFDLTNEDGIDELIEFILAEDDLRFSLRTES